MHFFSLLFFLPLIYAFWIHAECDNKNKLSVINAALRYVFYFESITHFAASVSFVETKGTISHAIYQKTLLNTKPVTEFAQYFFVNDWSSRCVRVSVCGVRLRERTLDCLCECFHENNLASIWRFRVCTLAVCGSFTWLSLSGRKNDEQSSKHAETCANTHTRVSRCARHVLVCI